MKGHLFCFGLGYVASQLRNILPEWKISGTHAHPDKVIPNEYLFNEKNELSVDKLDGVTHILVSIPPTENGDLVYLRFNKYLKSLKSLKWVGYFSSTSVYGDHQGAWVDETSKTIPMDIAGKNRLLAEKQWLSTNLPVTILRLAAIYGPGRSVIDRIRQGYATKIFKEGHFFSRIHVEDISLVIKNMLNNPKTPEIYNLADDFPCPQYEIVDFACDLMKVNSPQMINFEDAELSDQMKNYYMSSKRIDNSKLKNDFEVKLKFSNYKEGIVNLYSRETKYA